MLGKILLAFNPVSPLNWIVVVILAVTYKVSLKKRFEKFFAKDDGWLQGQKIKNFLLTLEGKRCLSGDKYCLTESRLHLLAVVALYMAITVPIYTVGCMFFPHLPPPVGPIMSFIC